MDDNNNLNTNNDFEPVNTEVNDTVPEPVQVADEDVFEPEPVPTFEEEQKPVSKQTDSEFFGEEPHYQTPPEYSDYAGVSGQSGSYQSSQSGSYQSGQSGSYQSGQYQSSSRYGGQYQARGEKPASKTLGILSLIFGIISLVFFCSCINIFTGVLAIIFGIIQLVSGRGAARGISIAGIVTAALSIVFFFIFWGAILGNDNIRDSVIEQYGDGDMDRFFEDYLDDYFDNFDVEINGGGRGGERNAPNMDDATQL